MTGLFRIVLKHKRKKFYDIPHKTTIMGSQPGYSVELFHNYFHKFDKRKYH